MTAKTGKAAGAQAATTPAARQPLSMVTRLAFGTGDVGQAMTANIIAFFLLFFLTTVAGLSGALAGTVILVAKIFDAVSDVLVGWLSDRTRSRFGRRRSWILFGAVPFGVSFFVIWLVPPLGDLGLFLYYLVVVVGFNLAFTVVSVPYTALTPDLTEDYHERTSLNAYRFGFSVSSGLVAALAHQLVVNSFCANPAACQVGELRQGYLLAGLGIALVSIPSFLLCVAGTRERPRPASSVQAASLLEQIRAIASNRPYLFVIGIYFCSWLALQVVSAVLPFYITFWLNLPDMLWVFIPLVQASALVWLFIWYNVSRRIGKKAVYLIGMTFWIVVQIGLFWLQPGATILAGTLCVLAGVGVATAYLIPWSMMPDVIEENELQTGHRYEGIAYGGMIFLQKLGIALGLFLVGVVLDWQGFNEEAAIGTQPESALFAIRFMIGVIPSIALIAGMALAAFYPISQQRHSEMLQQLEERRGSSA